MTRIYLVLSTRSSCCSHVSWLCWTINTYTGDASKGGRTMTESVFANMISAVLGATLLGFWKLIAVPWFQKITYQGPHLEGTWAFSHIENGPSDDQIVEVKQFGCHLKGIHTVHRWKDGSSANVKIPITGQVFGNRILLSGNDSNSGTLGSQLLEILDSATRLRGSVLTIEPTTGKICTHAREWVRK
jgi:hypothetical protein